MAENGRDVQAVTAQRDGIQAMLDTANQKLEGYDPEWKTKSETAARQAQAKVEALERGYAAERAVSGLKFSSESAKRAFLADLAKKKLPLQDGKLLGFDDHLKQYKETDRRPPHGGRGLKQGRQGRIACGYRCPQHCHGGKTLQRSEQCSKL